MIEIIKSAAQKMMIDFENTRKIQHQPTKGRAREYSVVEEFMRPYLPARYSIGSGIIVDAEHQQSRQQDLIIYDEFYSPVLLNMDSDKVLFPESVLASIEVKSNLTHKDVEDILEKSASVWRLFKSPLPHIVLSPGYGLHTQHAPTLCGSICFESSLDLDDLLEKIKQVRPEVKNGHALSFVCVLNDKSEKAGLVINVSEKNLANIELIPSHSSRLATIECNTPGDALLYTYLLLMEHLRHSGAITPGPNLLYYAEKSGLAIPMHSVSPDEQKGAAWECAGVLAEPETLERVRKLSQKVLQKTATDTDVLDWIYHLQFMPAGDVLPRPEATFRVGDKILDYPRPAEVIAAIRRDRENTASEKDEKLLADFLKVFRSAMSESSGFAMGVFDEPK